MSDRTMSEEQMDAEFENLVQSLFERVSSGDVDALEDFFSHEEKLSDPSNPVSPLDLSDEEALEGATLYMEYHAEIMEHLRGKADRLSAMVARQVDAFAAHRDAEWMADEAREFLDATEEDIKFLRDFGGDDDDDSVVDLSSASTRALLNEIENRTIA